MFRMIGLLLVILMLLAANARAALPDAGTAIGTAAVVEFVIDGEADRSISNLVTTTIAQVYANKIEAATALTGRAGEDIDIGFAVRNIGNGADDFKITVSDLSGKVTSFNLFSAENGIADEASGKPRNMGAEFTKAGIARGKASELAARVSIPAGTVGEMKFLISATGKQGKAGSETVTVTIADSKAFIVEPGNDVVLDDNQKAIPEFKVSGGADAGTGYFELMVENKAAPGTPVEFAVANNKIVFDGADVTADATRTGATFNIGNVQANFKTSFKTMIEIKGAKRGDVYVMFVKYAAKKGDALTTSKPIQISNAHEMKAPTLKVTGNSANAASKFDVIDSALSGETVHFALKLKNESTRPENFSLELKNMDDAIRSASLVDKYGNAFGAGSGTGLPETGLILPGKEIVFTLKVALKDGVTADGVNQLTLTVKSITEARTAAVEQEFSIGEIAAFALPSIAFHTEQASDKALTSMSVPGRDEVFQYFMTVAMPEGQGEGVRDYEIRFESTDTTFERNDSRTLSPASSMSVKLGAGAKGGLFLVQTHLRREDAVKVNVSVTDVKSGRTQLATLQLKKDAALGFMEPGYSDKGRVGLDTVTTVNIVNHGRAIKAEEYGIHAAESDKWNIAFSIDGKTWHDDLMLPEMTARGKQAIQVKIRVPKGVSPGSVQSLKLALRKKGVQADHASTVVTLAIGNSKLEISKAVAVVKKGESGPNAYAAQSAQTVEDGDTIWYRVVVTNPIDAPAAEHVKIIDPLPPHVKFASAKGNDKLVADGAKVTLEVGKLAPGDSKAMEYSVTVELQP